MKKSFVSLLLASSLFLPHAAFAAPDPRYPSLDAKQMGSLRNIVTLARQPHGVWTDMEQGPRGAFENYQFQLPWMSYALSVSQSQITPAYRELYKVTSERLIEKMLLSDTWDWWLDVLEVPGFKKYIEPGKDLRDPVKEKNIMYSGHLLQMIGHFEDMYGDHRYDKPGSIEFKIGGPSPLTAKYNHQELAKIIRDQFVESQFVGIECEPNLVFAECNQHPIVGLISYDKIHKANYADVRDEFWKKAATLGFVSNDSRRFAGPYRIKEEAMNKNPSVWNDGWSGTTLHAWNREAVQQIYPMQRDATVPGMLTDEADQVKVKWGQPSASTDFGFMAAYAAEVGDQNTRQTLLRYADNRLQPTWRGGRYFYPRHDVNVGGGAVTITGAEPQAIPGTNRDPPKPLPENKINERLVGPLTGNALLAFARLNPGAGLWKLTNDLAATYVDGGPEVIAVKYPEVLVNQAFYDKANDTLAVAVSPGTEYKGSTSFGIKNLNRNAVYDVTVDGVSAATIARGKVTAKSEATSLTWQPNGEVRVDLVLNDGRSVVVSRVVGQRVASR